MDTEGGPNPRSQSETQSRHPAAPPPGKRWWLVGLGAIATAFLAAVGTWLFSLVRPILDEPFERALEVNVDDSEQECDSYSLPAALLDDVPATAVEGGSPAQVASFDGRWIVDHGGLPTVSQTIDVDRTLELTLHGSGDETVVVHGIDVVDFEPLAVDDEMAVIHECRPRGGGDMGGMMDVSALAVDFAGQPPVLELTDPELRFPYQVSKDDPEGFDILIADNGTGDEEACFCRWNLGVSWSAGEDTEQTVIEGDSIGVATGIPLDAWPDYWFVDGEWTTEVPG
ncbi:hypothetical protein ACFPER_09815 [Agromyces aurantiacus]|uniref:DUF4179 domain-containing protein n=1 Tax=Agromyces aurantiacus TaxID=165814 RepID=A0ABV9R6K7_9MICO|nr:hypothetical protein [Agromyces aurantiacus]MBM7503770.1 hypothetical protein [Agromyces aurantiacus]